MFEANNSDRGQVGIGTLIVFIALVLVAAVAAGVLINTAGVLQGEAEASSQDAQAEVTNQIDVVTASGETVEDGGDNFVEGAELLVKKSAGADPVDLEEATIQYTSAEVSATLTHADTAGADNFETDGVGDLADDETVLSDVGDRIIVTLALDDIEPGAGLAEGGQATVELIDQSGAKTTFVLNPPSTFGGADYVSL